MPNTASAKKELRKAGKRKQRSLKIENNLKNLIKDSRRAIEAKKADAKELLAKTLKALDKAASKGVIKKNARDRKKSRLHKKFNQSLK
ncbi:MAG: 30S ribosomal protein S20 [bacterium]|nr:30S ribosomal protein S20 [bacterium]